MGRYHQHLHEQLDLSLSALEHMQKCFPDIVDKEEFRKIVGRYGITGRQQVRGSFLWSCRDIILKYERGIYILFFFCDFVPT